MKTKEQLAQEYAEKKVQNEYGISRETFIEASCRFGYDDVVQANIDGYTAGEQSQWRSVEEELPEENLTALCRLDDGEYIVARFDHMDVYNDDKGGVYAVPEWCVENGCESYTLDSEITHWMPIPSLLATNTEKQ